jgi:hypothetical protein
MLSPAPTPALDLTAQQHLLHSILLMGLALGVMTLLLSAISAIALWRIFVKAGEPGWAVFVPVYNVLLLLRIAVRFPWWLAAALAPLPFAVAFAVATAHDPLWMIGPDQVVVGVFFLLTMVTELTVVVLVGVGLARAFGRSDVFGVVALTLFSPIRYCLLGFGSARYFERPTPGAGV